MGCFKVGETEASNICSPQKMLTLRLLRILSPKPRHSQRTQASLGPGGLETLHSKSVLLVSSRYLRPWPLFLPTAPPVCLELRGIGGSLFYSFHSPGPKVPGLLRVAAPFWGLCAS